MLKEISSEKFRVPTIKFNSGLNVVLGDENATNSIGKSTLLMVIDFVFGGNSFIDYNKDVVQELGHHEYKFCFSFNGDQFFFKRGTYRPELVYVCNNKYEEIEPITLSDYTCFLKKKYAVQSEEVTFRGFVGLFARIWGKDNLNVRKPLHTVQTQSPSECVDLIIKMFNKYADIKELSSELKNINTERVALKKAFDTKILTKITKTSYKANSKKIDEVQKEIEDIKGNMAKYACNLNEIINKEILELKLEKDDLLQAKLQVQNKLSRIQRNLIEGKYIKSKNMVGLSRFFPNVNMKRILEIEEFHSELSNILKSELRESENELTVQLKNLNSGINDIDIKINMTLKSVENPSAIVDRVFDLAKIFSKIRSENEHYELDSGLSERIKNLKISLSELKVHTIKFIEDIVNTKIRNLVTQIYDEQRKCPVLVLGENNYKFDIHEDTGTGKAYSNLIAFDIAIFGSTSLPFIIHDSLLFKNIENDAVAKIIEIYNSTTKQSFISIDEIKKYGKVAASTLTAHSVVKLGDEKVLYIKDWRK